MQIIFHELGVYFSEAVALLVVFLLLLWWYSRISGRDGKSQCMLSWAQASKALHEVPVFFGPNQGANNWLVSSKLGEIIEKYLNGANGMLFKIRFFTNIWT